MLNPAAIVRATNYFALFRLSSASPARAAALWLVLNGVADMAVPLPENTPALLALGADRKAARRAYEAVRRGLSKLAEGDHVLERGGAGYPPLLAATADAPEFLFVRGDPGLLVRPAVAVVGTRRPTAAGVARAKRLGYLLARHGIVVVSGLARGIDRAAHEGCLVAGGRTVAVLGTPLDTAYPREHAPLQELIGEVGAVVSQFCPGFPVRRHFFPMRNATMSGLTLGTVVVEASETSGALIQAKKALEQGRKLFVPRSAVDNPALSWPRRFVEKGAVVFETFDELVSALKGAGLLERLGAGNEQKLELEIVQVHAR